MNCSRPALLIIALAFAAAVLPGCNDKNKTSANSMEKSSSASADTTNMAAVNDMCICNHPVGKAPVYTSYKGTSLAFCCKECRAQFSKMSYTEKDEYIEKLGEKKVSMGAMNDKCPITGAAVNKNAPTSTYNGKAVGFCCGGCAAKFEAMTPAKKDELLAKMAATK